MASTILDPVAEAISDLLAALSVTTTVRGQKWATIDLDALPCGVVELPTVTRHEPDESESQIGSEDWFLDFPVALYFDLSDPAFSQAQAVDTVEAFIAAVDDNPSLGIPTVLDAKVTEAVPEFLTDTHRPQILYACRLRVHRLVG